MRVSALKASLAPTLALMADVIRNPAFAPAEIERVRNIWLAQIQQEKAQPASLALRLMPRAIYGADSPYGTPLTGSGDEASIAKLTRDDLVRFHRERIRPDNVTFYVVGDIDLAGRHGRARSRVPRLERAGGARAAARERDRAGALVAAPDSRRPAQCAAELDLRRARDDAGRARRARSRRSR